MDTDFDFEDLWSRTVFLWSLQPCAPPTIPTGSPLTMTSHQSPRLRRPCSHPILSKRQFHVPTAWSWCFLQSKILPGASVAPWNLLKACQVPVESLLDPLTAPWVLWPESPPAQLHFSPHHGKIMSSSGVSPAHQGSLCRLQQRPRVKLQMDQALSLLSRGHLDTLTLSGKIADRALMLAAPPQTRTQTTACRDSLFGPKMAARLRATNPTTPSPLFVISWKTFKLDKRTIRTCQRAKTSGYMTETR